MATDDEDPYTAALATGWSPYAGSAPTSDYALVNPEWSSEGTGGIAPGSAPIGPGATSFGGKLQQLGSALGTLSGGAKPSQGTDSRPLPYPNVQAPVPPGSSMVGHPSAPISMSQLLQLLMQRRNAYMQAAANPRGAQPVTQALPTGQGLLGI